MNVPEESYTQKEVAEKFHVTVITVTRWRKSGKIEGFFKDRRWHYRKTDVHQLLDNPQVPSYIAERRPPTH